MDAITRKNLLENEKIYVPSRVISASLRYKVLSRQNWKCNTCFAHLKFRKSSQFGEENSAIDHIHPYADALTYVNGPSNINEEQNLQALCMTCNSNKGRKKA